MFTSREAQDVEESMERGMGKVTDDYEDLQRMIDELKTMHRQLLPPVRIERGYEIVGLEIVDILQDMALEGETEALEK